jgi:hypothetical protein
MEYQKQKKVVSDDKIKLVASQPSINSTYEKPPSAWSSVKQGYASTVGKALSHLKSSSNGYDKLKK